MQIRKIILKGESDAPKGVATLLVKPGDTRLSISPSGDLLTLLSEGKPLSFEKRSADAYTLPTTPRTLTMITLVNGEYLFGTEAPTEQRSYEKWTAFSLVGASVPCAGENAESTEISDKVERIDMGEEALFTPLKERTQHLAFTETVPVEKPAPSGTTTETTSAPAEAEETVSSPNETSRATFESEMEAGEPFPYFDRLIEGSRWVVIPDGGYLLGIFRDGEKSIEMCGVPGRIGVAPDEVHEWEYIPREDDEDEGYYIRKR